jgi:hypothetical protein
MDEPGSVAHRTRADVHAHVLAPENGIAYEGLSTRVRSGDTGFVFAVDPRFAAAATGAAVIKVTFLDRGRGSFDVTVGSATTAAVERNDSGKWLTATLALPAPLSTLGPSPHLRVGVARNGDDLVVRFVRVVRVTP